MVYSIYVDLLFMLNSFFDFILLYGVAAFTKNNYRLYRLIISALIGGIYGMCSLMPLMKIFYNGVILLLFPLLLLVIAFGKMSFANYIKMTVYYYLLSFAMCGVSAAGTNIFQSNGLAGEMFNLIFLPFVLIMIISKSTIGYFKRHIFKAHCITSGVAVFEKNKIAFKVFLDTGNNLRDTVSDLPVILITYEKIKSILPMELKDEYEFKTDENFKAVDFFAMVGEKYANAYWFNRISLLPFCSVGKKQGFIIGFKPHCIQINGKEINAVFGIHMGLFGNGTEFDSIINPLVLEEANNRIKGDKKCLN